MSLPDQPWPAPAASHPLRAHVSLPGSKSLSARALLLAATAHAPSTLHGVLESRDTQLMQAALTTLGASFTHSSAGSLEASPIPTGVRIPEGAHIDCGLAGTVMRFVPPLAVLASSPVTFDGDPAARCRPLAPVLDALTQLGARIEYHGQPGFLPFTLTPPAALPEAAEVAVDSSSSSQFLSALLLLGPLMPGGLMIRTTGHIPSLPHVAMTVASLREAGCEVTEPEVGTPENERRWQVSPGRPRGGERSIEPDLSNAGPFLAAALVAGGKVSIPHWPLHTTQAGDAWRELLPRLGGEVRIEHTSIAAQSSTPAAEESTTLTVTGTGHLTGIDADLSQVGELTPTVAALALLASPQGHGSRLTGIAHLRGHETDRLAALVTEMNRLGGRAHELPDGIEIEPLPDGERLRPALMHAYADHRMATFAAIIGLAVPGLTLDDVACTSKTLPDFPQMWAELLTSQEG